MRVLVVEDQPKIAAFIRSGLEETGFTVSLCRTGEDGLFQATHESYDAMVLDIMLPGRDGLSVLRTLRQKRVGLPIIILTARSGLEERVEGLDLGADDYLTKPFYVEELVARLRAQIRRTTGGSSPVLVAGPLKMDLLTHTVGVEDEEIHLGTREFSLLEYLLRSPGRVFTRSQIIQHVWDLHFDTGTNIVDVAVGRLRRKIRDAGGDDRVLETVRGVGYRFRAPNKPEP